MGSVEEIILVILIPVAIFSSVGFGILIGREYGTLENFVIKILNDFKDKMNQK